MRILRLNLGHGESNLALHPLEEDEFNRQLGLRMNEAYPAASLPGDLLTKIQAAVEREADMEKINNQGRWRIFRNLFTWLSLKLQK